MIYPKFIKENDLIGVPAPSDGGYCKEKNIRYENAKKNIEKMGFKVEMSKNIFNSEKGRSSDAITRAKELNEMFENKTNCILCAAGGEFLLEILPYVNFEKIVNNPKWVVGFSDPTGILFPLTMKYDIATIYGNNFSTFGMENLHKSLTDSIEMLKGNLFIQNSFELYEEQWPEKVTGLEGYNLDSKVCWKTINKGDVNVTGRIIAGCIDIIIELAGTKYDGVNDFNDKYKQDGIIWCFDNCELSKEELIRTLWKFNEMDYFKYTKAVIFGRNGQDISCYDYTMEQTILDSVLSKYDIPIIYDTDISHKGPTINIINGSIATVNVKNGKGSIKFELK